MPFSILDLPHYITKAIEKLGYNEPTAVQEEVIPLIREGKDLMIEAPTGTGKTAAYVLPFIQQMNEMNSEPSNRTIQNLTLAPTRELALQVSSFYASISEFSPREIKIVTLIGGEPIGDQAAALQRGVDIVVATPGRLLDLLRTNEVNLKESKLIIFDEADKLFDVDFTEEIHDLLRQLPEKRQTLFFSATLPKKVIDLSEKLLTDPVNVVIHPPEKVTASIHQRAINVNRDTRRALLQHLLVKEKWENVMVFVASKRAAFNLGGKLHRAGFSVDSFHGDLCQEERIAVLEEFKNKEFTILISTDIAARGIDITKLALVVNYDLPRSPAGYVHRIGRTGRAGEEGQAISFIDHEDEAHFRLIEKRMGMRLEREQIEGFELRGEAPQKVKGSGPVKGKRKSKKDKLRELQPASSLWKRPSS